MKMSRTKICLAALAAVSMCAVFAADGGKTASLAEARGGIGEAISSPEAMESAINSLSAADQVAFLGEVNAAIAKRQASKEEKAAMFLKANAAALKAAKGGKGNMKALLAEVYASASVLSLAAINEKFAEDLFNRSADPNKSYTDEQYTDIAVDTLKAIVRRCDSADSSSVRDTFGLLMLVRASNGTPDTLTDRLLQEIPEEDRKAAQEEWIPAALGRDGHEKSYEQILSAADAEAEPNLDIIIKIYGPQQIDTLVADLVEGVPTLRPHIEEPTMQTPIDASTGVGGDGPSMPAPASTPIPTPTPEPVPPTPPYQSQLP